MLKGQKTYIVAVLLVGYGVIGYFLGDHSWQDALKTALEGSGLAALRNAVA